MPARPNRFCHTDERKTGLDARNHHVSGAEPTIGPELSERIEQVRAALPDSEPLDVEDAISRYLT